LVSIWDTNGTRANLRLVTERGLVHPTGRRAAGARDPA
jgi:hypothetical protein